MGQEDLIKHLKEDTRILQSSQLEEALRAVDRKFFVPNERQDEAYEDYPLPIGYGATISQPTTVAFMLAKLDVREGQKVLDIGSGSGWTPALLAHLVGPKGIPPHQSAAADWCGGKVIGLEIVPELVELGRQNIRRYYSHILKNMRIVRAQIPEIRQVKKGAVGLSSEAPFDRILVSAAAREIPKELVEQLKRDGVMILPVGKEGEIQRLVRIHKKPDGALESEEYPGFAFVPLR